ncbi:MAG: hypothetical protein ACK5BF_04360 [Hyphomonadaceae bacterium]|jgi:uncharacterized protein YndB with AHSA1/START domain
MRIWLGVALGMLCSTSALAGVQTASASQATLVYDLELAGPPSDAWKHVVDIAAWWWSEHTYSGQAKNLSLAVSPGGCWCKSWVGGGVEHARVVMAIPGRALRIEGGFGPLQGMAVKATMTFTLKPAADPSKTQLHVVYLVNGTVESKLDGLAGPVDGVLATQFGRLAALK